jgi:hypothetical protein
MLENTQRRIGAKNDMESGENRGTTHGKWAQMAKTLRGKVATGYFQRLSRHI